MQERSGARRSLLALGHLAALSTFAFAQPLFDLLGKNAEFFAARGSSRLDILVFAVGLVLLPPLVLLAVEELAGLASAGLRYGLHLFFIAVLAAVVALQALRGAIHAATPAIVVALALGVALAAAYSRLEPVRSFFTVLSPAPVVFLVLFLFFSPVSKLVLPQGSEVRAASIGARAPVLWIVLDEVPVTTFMDSSGHVDAGRYPNLARLAHDATWYRNTASVHQNTPYAVPAILDGREPTASRLPIAADHPRTVFQLFGRDYRMHVSEEATSICPPDLCREKRDDFGERMRSMTSDLSLVYEHVLLPRSLEDKLPSVSENWGDFGGGVADTEKNPLPSSSTQATKAERKNRLRGYLNRGRPGRFEDFVHGIDKAPGKPQFALKHTLFPHVPYQYLPSGRAYSNTPKEAIPGLNSRQGYGNQFLQDQGWQRHVLQAGDADRLIGSAIRRMKEEGTYDDALVVVVSDHGVSFKKGHDRRNVFPGNVADIAPVPFFLKAPGQRRGRISDKPLRTIDVLPTVAGVLGIHIPWHVDGRSALRPTVAAQRHRTQLSRTWKKVPVDTAGYQADRRAALARRIALLGQHDWRSPFRMGPDPELLGRSVASLRPAASSGPTARFNGAGALRSVDLGSAFAPVHLTGRLAGGRRGGGRRLAVAVNGRVRATGLSFTLQGSSDEDFSLLVPESSLRPGRNRVELLWVLGPGRTERLGAI